MCATGDSQCLVYLGCITLPSSLKVELAIKLQTAGMSCGPALSKKGSILKGTVLKHPNNDALITQFRLLCTNLIYLLKIEMLPK